MATRIEVKVPDIGDFSDVPVIEILVKPGERVQTETPLVTLESDKATMDVPSPVDGVVASIAVKVGDKVSEGTHLLDIDADNAPAGVAPPERVKESGHATAAGAPAADYGTAGVYEAVVYAAELTDIQTNQVVPHTWSPGPARALRRPVSSQSSY